jgi:acyl carrier protein
MTLEEFTSEIIQEFEAVGEKNVNENTNFRNLDCWSSMFALVIIAKIDEIYDFLISAEDLKKANTISDLYQILQTQQTL